MKPLSIGRAWEETVAFINREAALLFPVAFLFMALPVVLFQQLVPPDTMQGILDAMRKAEAGGARTPVSIPADFLIGFILTMIVSLIGALTINALALRAGISVGEAMKLGLQRLPVLLGAGLMIGIAGGLAAILLAVLGVLVSIVGGTAAVTAVLTIAIFGVLCFVVVRLLLLNALAIDRPVRPLEAIRQSWALTRGQFWRLLAFLIVVMVLSIVVQAAVQSVFGVIGGLVGGAGVATLAAGLATAAVSAVIQVYFIVMIARIYRQLEAAA